MNILELKEAQGLTVAIVRAHLKSTGWTLHNMGVYQEWHRPGCKPPCASVIYDKSTAAHKDGDSAHAMDIHAALATIAGYERRKMVDLIRQLNPRMRKGLPSEAAMSAHDLWMLTECELGLHRSRTSGGIRDIQKHGGFDGENISHWPCDKHANKVRYPVDDKGVML